MLRIIPSLDLIYIYSKKYTEIEYNHLLPVLTKRNAEYIPKIVVYVNWNIDTKNDANTS